MGSDRQGEYRQPPGQPPPPILETPIDRLIDDLFGSTAPCIGARERAYLHNEIERLREWARRRYHPFPDIGNMTCPDVRDTTCFPSAMHNGDPALEG